jgi:hypothetical protein
MRRIPFKGEIRADAPRRVAPAAMPAPESPPVSGAGGELPDLRDFIRGRRAALAGFMEQGASLEMDGDLLTVTPRNDIYVRYLNDNRHVIGELASELYGRRIKVEMAAVGATKTPGSNPPELPDSRVADSSPSQPTPSAAPDMKGSPEGDAGAPEPAAAAGAPGEQTQPDARQKLYADPLVQHIFEEFDARLVELKTTSTRPDASAPAVSKK